MWWLLLALAGAETYWVDADADGFGDPDAQIDTPATTPPAGYTTNDRDCDDGDPAVHPGVPDDCDAIDNDCDGFPDDGGVCPCPTEYRNGHAYQFCTTPTPWLEARDRCGLNGYHLVSVATAAENVWVDNTADTYSLEKWWFGLTDAAVEGIWIWDDGSDLLYSNWHSGEPNDAGGEDCVQFNRWSDLTWNDEPCSASFRYICESAVLVTWFVDSDGDGWGDSSGATIVASDQPGGPWIDRGGDCDDNNPNRFPDNPDVCDGFDNDCDNLPDGGLSSPPMYSDGDADGWGAGGVLRRNCATDADVAVDGDCDDTNADVNPDAVEFCNDVDDDCNGLVDDDAVDQINVWPDADADGFGDQDVMGVACEPGPGQVLDGSDCDDSDAGVHPGSIERCNHIDDDCNGVVDDNPVDTLTLYADADGDGYGESTGTSYEFCFLTDPYVANDLDCDDTSALIFPGALEVVGDGIDQDCDGFDALPPTDTGEPDTAVEDTSIGDDPPRPDTAGTDTEPDDTDDWVAPDRDFGQVQGGGGCRCDTGGQPGGLGWLLLCLSVWGRSRRRTRRGPSAKNAGT